WALLLPSFHGSIPPQGVWHHDNIRSTTVVLGQPPASQLRLRTNGPHHSLYRGASARGDASRPPRQDAWLPYRCQSRMQPHELFIFEHFDPGGAIVVGPDRFIDAGKRDIDTTSARFYE